uniref:C-type lectin domain-containing protein n=1 Tax=Sander lucioperca TaxID=283035 RepID=A0A8C9XE91_SANLU
PKITVYYHLTGSIAAVSSLLSGQCSSIGGQLCDYHFIRYEKTWEEAQKYCRKNHTDLATVSNQTDMKRLRSSTTAKPPYKAWIGLQENTPNIVWRWSLPGVNFSFRSWDKDEPKKTCAMTTSDGKWSSDDCNNKKPFFCYDDSVILIKKNMTWVDALYYCRDHYRDLVSITNQDEQLWVQERAKMASTPYVWLGLRYTCTLDFWFWVTDETVLYTNLDPDQSGDDCNVSGAMDRNGTHQWVKMIDDNYKFNFICSK